MTTSNVTKLRPVIPGPVADWTNRTTLYDTESLGYLLAELDAGRKLAASVRRDRGRVSKAAFTPLEAAVTDSLVICARALEENYDPAATPIAKRRVATIVVKNRRVGRETYDAQDIHLAAAAGSALGRMYFQAQRGKGGPIILKRFEASAGGI